MFLYFADKKHLYLRDTMYNAARILIFILFLFVSFFLLVPKAQATTVIDIFAGNQNSCAVFSDNTVKCWGYNYYGQLGDGTTNTSTTPVAVAGITTATSVSMGGHHTCARLSDGTVKCWGRNNYGQLGNGTNSNSTTPVSVSGITTATVITTGGNWSCARLSDGTVKCWGGNWDGQLGDGTYNSSNVPVSVTGISTATTVSTRGSQTCAVLSDNTVKCWGSNSDGQLGDGTYNSSNVPVSVTGISTATAVSVGGYHVCARLSDGTIKCWGYNGDGQLGDGTWDSSPTPVTVTGITNATTVSAKAEHSCARLSSGTVKCWGYGGNGELGDGTYNDSNVPVSVTGITTATTVSMGGYHACVIYSDGAAACWGYNGDGQLGDGTYDDSLTQVFIPGTYTVSAPTIASPTSTITGDSATVSAMINRNYGTTNAFFLWGTAGGSCSSLPNTTGETDMSVYSLNSAQAFTVTIPGLVPGATYSYCPVVYNSAGIAYGSVNTFSPTLGGSVCSGVADNSDYTVSSNCIMKKTIDGADKGSGNKNTALMQISSGQTLTVNSGQIVTYGILYKPGGSITRFTGGTLKRGAVWEPDTDGDGYPDTVGYSSMIVSDSQPTGYVRRILANANVDCAPNDATKWHYSTGTEDADGDTYTSKSYTRPVCIGVSLAAAGCVASASTVDCNDSNANIYQNVASLVVDADYDGYKTADAATTYCVGGQLTNTNGTGRTYYRGPSGAPYYLVSGQVLGSGVTDCDDSTGAPCAPTGGSAATVLVSGSSQMTVNFTPNTTNGPAASNYTVYYATGTLTGAQLLSTGSTATNFSSGSNVTGLSGSTLYSFGVVANNASGSSQISSPFTQTTNATCSDSIGYRDFDKDGYGTGSNGCYVASGSYNVVGNNTDCDDHDVTKYQWLDGYTNYDGDASYAMARTKVCSGAALPSGYGSSAGTDPNDYSASVTTALTGYTDIATGGISTCGVVGGVVKCWGYNSYGQLGNGTTTASTIPTAVSGISTATNVAVGYGFACALLSGGTVQCWGYNYYGQLGNGTTTNSTTPVSVTGITTATGISVGTSFACALLSGGTVQCWGYNYYGQLGNGTTTNSSTPVSVSSITAATQISASSTGNYACARLSNSTIQCWGANESYQLGNGTTTNSTTPVSVQAMTTAVSVSAGSGGNSLACARLSDNTVKCWGYINSTFYSSPTSISGITTSTSIAAGARFVCSVISGGTVMCSGDNSYGQLGNNSFTNSGLTAVNVLDLSSVSKIAVSDYTVCALLTGGQIRCWGQGTRMQFGNNQLSPSSNYNYMGSTPIYLPSTIRGLTGVTKVVSGNINGAYSYCALFSNGGVKCWGHQGSLNNSGLPQYVGGVYNAIDLAMGYGFACAIISGGTVQCWGDYNYYGSLGNGTTTASLTPVNVLNITNASKIVAAGNTVCAVLSDGTVQCWGQNNSGQLGNGTTTSGATSTPVSVSGITTATHIGMYNSSVCVRLSNSTIQCWGDDSYGQLGNGVSTGTYTTPVSVSGITTAINVSGGETYATFCAVLSDTTGRCWGDNSRYHLGNGSNVNSSTPVVVSGLTGAIYISATDANYAITNTGGVLFWGMGSNGERGYGDYYSYTTPQTANITNATSVARSTNYTSVCMSVSGGTVQCWGAPSYNDMWGWDNSYDATPRTAVSQ